MEPPWNELGRDLHHLGISDPAVAKKLYEMGWRRFHRAEVIHISDPATIDHTALIESITRATIRQSRRGLYGG